MYVGAKLFDALKVSNGALLSSVGSARDPCAEALQQSWARLRARVPSLRVTPPLLPCSLSHSSAILSIKPEKAKKIYKKPKKKTLAIRF